MYYFIFFCLFFLQAYAADDQSPEAFMLQLRETEREITPGDENKSGLLRAALARDDIAVVDMILSSQKGGENIDLNFQDINGTSLLAYCVSVQAAKILVKYGAEISMASWNSIKGCDLIWGICSGSYEGNQNDFLSYYLQDKLLGKKNSLRWIEAVSRNKHGESGERIERVEILLDHGCEYNDEIKQKMCDNVDAKSRERVEQLFITYERGNIKPAKR